MHIWTIILEAKAYKQGHIYVNILTWPDYYSMSHSWIKIWIEWFEKIFSSEGNSSLWSITGADKCFSMAQVAW